MVGQERDVDTANLMFAALHNQPAGRLAFPQDYFVHGPLVFTFIEMLLRLVLHSEKLANTILGPAQSAEVVAAAALVNLQQQVCVVVRHWPDTNRVPIV